VGDDLGGEAFERVFRRQTRDGGIGPVQRVFGAEDVELLEAVVIVAALDDGGAFGVDELVAGRRRRDRRDLVGVLAPRAFELLGGAGADRVVLRGGVDGANREA